jgi:aminoglycoside phosphotransferase (APT) family kinase protein
MTTASAHANEIDVHAELVRRLIAAQFPRWASLLLQSIPSIGTVNAIWRLGDDMVVRLPRVDWAIDGMERELTWLPWLALRLSIPIPELLGAGIPGEGYPWPWAVCRWLPGRNPQLGRLADPAGLAGDLAAFLAELWRLDPAPGPPSDQSLANHDAPVREAIAVLARDGEIDPGPIITAWDAALAAPPWDGSPVWIHGDLSPGNMLVDGAGRLAAAIDFSSVGAGDSAGDLKVAWNLLPGEAREPFRRALGVDDATWARARGKALAQAVTHLRYYRESRPALAAAGRRVITEVLADRHGAP